MKKHESLKAAIREYNETAYLQAQSAVGGHKSASRDYITQMAGMLKIISTVWNEDIDYKFIERHGTTDDGKPMFFYEIMEVI